MSSVSTRVSALSPEQRRLLADKLKARTQGTRIRAQAPRDSPAALSYAQQRLWFLQQLQPESSQYNLPAAARIRGPLDVAALRRSFAEIVGRHESLRTTFAAEDGTPVQIVNPSAASELTMTTVSGDEELASRIAAEAGRPFDLARGPLFRAELLQRAADDYVLVLNVHHIVSDSRHPRRRVAGSLRRVLQETAIAAGGGRPAVCRLCRVAARARAGASHCLSTRVLAPAARGRAAGA
jgi:hypothetical protein